MSKTDIEWAEGHWEPVGGCADASEGCAHCYARERQLPRLAGAYPERYASLVTRAPKGADRCRQWTGETAFWPDRLVEPLHWQKPRGRQFVCSQSDLFYESRPWTEMAAVWAVMAACPETTFLVLTKRPQIAKVFLTAKTTFGHIAQAIWNAAVKVLPGWARTRIAERWHPGEVWPLPNVWLGVSVENQVRAEERIPLLLDTPAAKRFVSYEPALSLVRLWDHFCCSECGYTPRDEVIHGDHDLCGNQPRRIDWVIAGAESGRGARPAELDWFRSVRDECVRSGVPFFLKQLVHDGKKLSLPELDGRQWTEVPQ